MPIYSSHPSAIIDEGCSIGSSTKIRHFTPIMTCAVIGENCNIGQNLVISPGVVLGNNVKVQNNVSLYTGVVCEDDNWNNQKFRLTNRRPFSESSIR